MNFDALEAGTSVRGNERENSAFFPDVRVLLACAALLVLVGRVATIIGSELFPDEALYAWLSRVDPFGFAPHPPGVPFLVRLGTGLLGRTEEGVRLGSFLLASLTPVVVYALAREIGGRTVALWSALAAVAVPLYGAIGAITTPDAPQLLIWSVALLLTHRALVTGRAGWWAGAGAVVGLGLFVKYIIVLYFPSLALCLILSPTWRRSLRTPGPWLALLIAFLLFAPAFLWNQSTTGWSAVRYHLEDRQELIFPSVREFLIYQGLHALYISPLLYGLALAGMVWAGREGIRRSDGNLIFLFSFGSVMWLFFAVIAVVTKRELSREQWDAPAYVPALIAAALLIREKSALAVSGRRNWWSRAAWAAPLTGLAIFGVMSAEGLTGHITGLLGRAPLYANFRGWKAMATGADQVLADLPAGPSPAIFLGNSFVEAQQFHFYSRLADPARVYTLDNSANDRFGLERVLKQEGVNQGALARVAPGTNAVFANVWTVERGEEAPSRDRRKEKLERLFERVETLPDIEVSLAGREIRRCRLYRCLGLRGEKPRPSKKQAGLSGGQPHREG